MGAGIPKNPGTSPGGGIPKNPSTPPGGTPDPGGSKASGGPPGETPVEVTPEMLHKEAQHWADTSDAWTKTITDRIKSLTSDRTKFGMMADAFPSYSDLLERLKTLAASGGQEFKAISDALQSASGDYQEAEEQNKQSAKQLAPADQPRKDGPTAV